jgi:hypothetical protein
LDEDDGPTANVHDVDAVFIPLGDDDAGDGNMDGMPSLGDDAMEMEILDSSDID